MALDHLDHQQSRARKRNHHRGPLPCRCCLWHLSVTETERTQVVCGVGSCNLRSHNLCLSYKSGGSLVRADNGLRVCSLVNAGGMRPATAWMITYRARVMRLIPQKQKQLLPPSSVLPSPSRFLSPLCSFLSSSSFLDPRCSGINRKLSSAHGLPSPVGVITDGNLPSAHQLFAFRRYYSTC